MSVVSDLGYNKYAVFAEVAGRLKDETGVDLVLVGGSAFEWHFPILHASEDLDAVIRAMTAAPQRVLLKILQDCGFRRVGRIFVSGDCPFSFDIVGTVLGLPPRGIGQDVEIASAPITHKPFILLTATMMWVDRAIAWEAMPGSDRDARHCLSVVRDFPGKVDFSRAHEVLREFGILGLLHRRVKGLAEWKGFEWAFDA